MNTEFNEWANSPVNLSTREIADPFLVIDDFFSADDLNGHLEALKKWRDRVIGAGYYTDLKGSPAGLVMRRTLNMRLAECAFILMKSLKADCLSKSLELDADLNKTEVVFVKGVLNETEISNPYLVLNSFFREHDLAWYRLQLEEWFESALSVGAAREFVEGPDLVLVYENLQRLYAAMWLLLHNKRDIVETEQKGQLEVSRVRLYHLDRETLPLHQEMLANLVSVILKKLPSVYAVYYLGSKPGSPNSAFLLVLTSDDEEGEALSLGTMLEESCRPASVVILVHYASAVVNAIHQGDRFFNRALCCPPLYISGDMLLPHSDVLKPNAVTELGEANWERWRKQAKEFLLGAEYYLSVKAYSAALFSLHQCAEDILIAIVRSVLGYKINSHNLLRLLRVTQFFTNDFTAIFQMDTDQGKTNFNLLKDAYINVRYRDNYSPDSSSLDVLYPLVAKLLATAEQVHEQFLLRNTI